MGLPRIIQKECGVQAGESELLRGGVIQQGVAIMGLCGFEVAVPIVGVAQSIVRLNLHVHIVHLFGDGQGFVQVIQGLADRFLELVGTEFALKRSSLEQQLPPVPIDVLEFCFQELGQKINAFQILAARSEELGLLDRQLDPLIPREGFLEQEINQSDGFLLVGQDGREVEIGLNPLLEDSGGVAQNLTEFSRRRAVLLLLAPRRLGSDGQEGHKADAEKGAQGEWHGGRTKIQREFTPRPGWNFSRLVPLEISSTFALPFGEKPTL